MLKLIKTSNGLAFFQEEGLDPKSLLKNADPALYAANEAGRNTVRAFKKS